MIEYQPHNENASFSVASETNVDSNYLEEQKAPFLEKFQDLAGSPVEVDNLIDITQLSRDQLYHVKVPIMLANNGTIKELLKFMADNQIKGIITTKHVEFEDLKKMVERMTDEQKEEIRALFY